MIEILKRSHMGALFSSLMLMVESVLLNMVMGIIKQASSLSVVMATGGITPVTQKPLKRREMPFWDDWHWNKLHIWWVCQFTITHFLSLSQTAADHGERKHGFLGNNRLVRADRRNNTVCFHTHTYTHTHTHTHTHTVREDRLIPWQHRKHINICKIIHPKIKMQPSFTLPYVVWNRMFFSSMQHKSSCLAESSCCSFCALKVNEVCQYLVFYYYYIYIVHKSFAYHFYGAYCHFNWIHCRWIGKNWKFLKN